jgi:hypothetical protein
MSASCRQADYAELGFLGRAPLDHRVDIATEANEPKPNGRASVR